MADKKKNLGKQDYKPGLIEKKWQVVWEKEKIYSPNLDKAKKPFYNLMMFPYPSAEGMHVGNMYAFTGADVYGRFMRMKGNDVFEPIGLDGFGIHSENYAIKVGQHPKEQAKISEKNFYRQLRATGNGFDWSRKLETYDPNYYKWTQWLFIQLFKAGLAYRAKAKVNWCPSCKTVLADEQVIQKIKNQKSKVKSTNQKSKISVDPRSDQRKSAEEVVKEVSVNVCERCETEVVKKELEQWFFRITKYADRLLTNIAKLDWTEKVKIAQRQWIGKSEGARISFPVILRERSDREDPIGISRSARNDSESIEVFTTRPDTLYGATFLVLSPEHPLVAELLKSKIKNQKSKVDEISKYVQEAKRRTEQERMAEGKDPSTGSGQGKTGVFSGLYAINPLNQEKLPVWIADYAVMGYGTGALFGDAHDKRDVEFAKKYKIPLKPTILTGDKEKDERIKKLEECYTGEGILFDSGEFSGLTSADAKKKIVARLEKLGKGKRETTYHLRDWLISRQRYWGPPIPMIFCQRCANEGKSWFSEHSENSARQKVRRSDKSDSLKLRFTEYSEFSEMRGWYPDENLPVLLPDVKDWKPTGTGKSPLATVESFVNTKCPNCKGPAKREPDVSDNFLDSSWYFLRYLATDYDSIPFPSKAFIPEYSENSASQKVRLSDKSDNVKLRPSESSEFSEVSKRGDKWLPVSMYIGGAEHSVLHLLYSRFITMVLRDLGFIEFEEPFSRFYAHGLLVKEGAKMSKSKGNVVVPDEYIKKYGADTLRCYLMFLGPFNQGGDFYDTALEGMFRFLKRVWILVHGKKDSMKTKNDSNRSLFGSNEAYVFMHKTIKRVKDDIENLRYNTAIAALMEYYNFLSKQEYIAIEEFRNLLKLLSPFAPYIAEELWEYIGGKFSIHKELFPKFDQNALRSFGKTIAIQINGRLRGIAGVTDQASKNKNTIEQIARDRDKVKKYLEGKPIKKVIYVEGKVINFVTE